jgi:hypothetical protein
MSPQEYIEHLKREVEAWEMIAMGAIKDRERLEREVKTLKAQLEYRFFHPVLENADPQELARFLEHR